jgi:hypothetical protein
MYYPVVHAHHCNAQLSPDCHKGFVKSCSPTDTILSGYQHLSRTEIENIDRYLLEKARFGHLVEKPASLVDAEEMLVLWRLLQKETGKIYGFCDLDPQGLVVALLEHPGEHPIQIETLCFFCRRVLRERESSQTELASA